ncbi:MAG: TIGR04282 family arsenosugar biosynthesis glycosyltransferase [Armatimonadetes bacterium]|nr:TIGR04282 family arsenosugar biosynthesis glycosyltransferase [Armatimonadota bacterium]
MSSVPAVIVFARAPRPGVTKTRLIPALGPEGAAELYGCFVTDTLAMLRCLPADVVVAAAEPEDAEGIKGILRDVCPCAQFMLQSRGDLGHRLGAAAADVLARGHSHVVVIGTDSPTLPPEIVAQALKLAASYDCVLGPSFDGGYYLIALRAVPHALFADIDWSSTQVLTQTIAHAQREALSVALLEPWYDVDTPQDLALLRTHLSWHVAESRPVPCPRTWDALGRLFAGADT